MIRWCIAVTMLAACGRVSFDATSDATAADATTVRPATFDADFTKGDLGPFTFTRDSRGSYLGADRRIRYAEANEPRFDHHPASGQPRGILLEGAGENLAFYSEQFDVGADWFTNEDFAGAVTVTPDVAMAPDGSMTADEVTETDSASFNRRAQIVAVTDDTLEYVCSAFLKAGTSTLRSFSCELLGGTIIQVDMHVDLANGTVLEIEPGAAAHGIAKYADGWWRVWITLRNNATGNDRVVLSVLGYRPDASVNGSVLVWGAQVENSVAPTSYIPTPSNASVVRAADTATTTDLSWLDVTMGSLLVSGELAIVRDRDQHAMCFVDIGPGYTCVSRHGPTGTAALLYQGTPFIEGSAWTGEPATVLIAQAPPELALHDPGGVATTQAPLPADGYEMLALGNDGTQWFDGWVRRIAYWPFLLTSDERTSIGVK